MDALSLHPVSYVPTCTHETDLHLEAEERRNRFSFMNKSFIRNVIRQNLGLLLSMNIIVDIAYLVSGIYTNFRRLLSKTCDVG